MWHDIKSLRGEDTFGKRECYHQFLSDVITSPAELATQINVFFTGITQEFETLMQAQTPSNVVPLDLIVSLEEVRPTCSNCLHIKRWDQISNKMLKQFALELAP